MSDSDYDSDQEEGEEEDYKSSYDRGNGKKVDNKGDIVDEAVKFSSLADDVFGGDISDDDELDHLRRKERGQNKRKKEENSMPDYMLFDFRRGAEDFPSNCTIIDPIEAEALLEKKTADILEKLKSKKKEGDDNKNDGAFEDSFADWGGNKNVDEETCKENHLKLLEEAVFETLSDGSTALVIKPGYRLKLDLSELLEGGDAEKEEREKQKKKEEKKKSKYTSFSSWGVSSDLKMGPSVGMMSGGDMGFGVDDLWGDFWFKPKQYIDEYTITMDVKLLDEPPRDGISLFQTALIHAKENKKTGKTTLSKSEGECIINQAGGVGQLGSYGDITKTKVKVNCWTRVVIAVKCVKSGDGKVVEKGHMRTWIGAQSGVTLKDEAFEAGGRFSIDPDSLFLFSSTQSTMMPGRIAIRTVRVERTFADDQYVRENRARDKISNIFIEERIQEVKKQQKGLSLASLFVKPRPIWSAQAFYGYFGDMFVENTSLENADNLAWSYNVINHAMQNMITQNILTDPRSGIEQITRGFISDVIFSMQQSIPLFKQMLKLMTKRNEGTLLSFLKKMKALLVALKAGNSLLLPVVVENAELLILVERVTYRAFRFVIVQTNPTGGLRHHAVSPHHDVPHLTYRTCLVLSNISKKNALDDVFWMGLYNLSIHPRVGDMDRFYDILVPFLTGEPLESSLVRAEQHARLAEECKLQMNQFYTEAVRLSREGNIDSSTEMLAAADTKRDEYIQNLASSGAWRHPQKSKTAYVRCIIEAFHYMLLRRGISELQIEQIHLALFTEMVCMMKQDLKSVFPDENGMRVCKLAVQELCHATVRLVDAYDMNDCKEESKIDSGFVLNEIYDLTHSVNEQLSHCSFGHDESLSALDLKGKKSNDPNDPLLTQFKNALMWDVEQCDVDPGQSISLTKYIPINFLQIPSKATTMTEAITAIRMCDRLATLLENQSHCIKNFKFLIVSCIEHVFVHVVPVPKPRGVTLSQEDLYKADRSRRMDQKKKAAEAKVSIDKLTDSSKSLTTKVDKNYKTDKEETTIETDKEAQRRVAEEDLDISVGEEILKASSEAYCIWGQSMDYATQVELLLTLQRVMEHFTAATMSLQQSKSFDGTCIIVPGCITAIADAVIRKIATDEPSEVCSQLSGRTLQGKQLGIPGFGIRVSSFATQCETIELHNAELCVARTAVIDYFQSPAQTRLETMFNWEDNYYLTPNRGTIKYLRHCAREIGFKSNNIHHQLIDETICSSILMKNYPELRCYRDIVFWWKFFMNTDRKAFPNYMNPDQPHEIQGRRRLDAQLHWTWDQENQAYKAIGFGMELACRPNPKQVDPVTNKVPPAEFLPTHRFPSTATPSFYLPAPAIKTEDDVIYRPNLPSFENEYGQVLNQRDSELLISYLTVPYIRLPLILTFFSTEDRIHKLQSPELRLILDSVMFEPGKYLRMDMTNVEPKMVPTLNPELLSSPFGLLMNELIHSPDTIIKSLITLLKGALVCDTGTVVDAKKDEFNVSTRIILYMSLLGARADNYLSFLVDHASEQRKTVHHTLRGAEVDKKTLEKLIVGRAKIRELLNDQFSALIEDYLNKLENEVLYDPSNEKLIDRNSRLACDLHAHKFAIYRNYHQEDLSPNIAKTIIGSFLYLTTRHTWNKATKEESRLCVPETEIYEVMYVMRRMIINYVSSCKQGICDEIMQTALQISSSQTGSMKKNAMVLDAQNRWSKIMGDRSIGRWAVGSTRTLPTSGDSNDSLQNAVDVKTMTIQRQSSYENDVGEVGDTSMLGVEIDVQVGQMTLRSKYLAALSSNIANHEDMIELFGDQTIQASQLEDAENRKRYKLVGLNYEIHHWPKEHKSCPPVGDEWDREYDPADLAPSEKWIISIFEPVRKTFYVQNSPFDPPTMQFIMPESPYPASAEVVVMLGLHQSLGNKYKLVYIFRRLRCVHVYEVVSQGRQWWFTMHLTTDYRYALTELSQSTQTRNQQYPEWWLRGAGMPYPTRKPDEKIFNNIEDQTTESVLIIRDAEHTLNISGGKETFVPRRLLHGAIPDALLDAYDFWQDESTLPQNATEEDIRNSSFGYQKLRGYPKACSDQEYMLIVEIKFTGSWSKVNTMAQMYNDADEYKNDPMTIQATGLPGRTVAVTKRPTVLMKEEYELYSRVASTIESLKLIRSVDKKKKKSKASTKQEKFTLDQKIAADYSGHGEYINGVISRVNDDGTYDVEYVDAHKWIGVQRKVSSNKIRKRESKSTESIVRWDGMSDDEDAIWADFSDEDDQDKDQELEEKERISFDAFNEIFRLLKASRFDEDLLLHTLHRISQSHENFSDIHRLIRAVEEHSFIASEVDAAMSIEPFDREDMVLLNLAYAPRRSGLYSLMKTLTRIEILGQICAWTKLSNDGVKRSEGCIGLEFGEAPLDIIELPRLKLAFNARCDHQGVLRLYSIDHGDLFITTETNEMTEKMLSGIPHSLLLTSVRGEMQVLVPVIAPKRPVILSEPFSTFIVLDHSDVLQRAERFFLYPLHVSLSFLMTKGLNSAVYLMLLRFIHRDYLDVFRLADSIATDTKFNEEGLMILENFSEVDNDYHPDAHACRLKISLVILDSGMKLPWDLTHQCARYALKISRVSSACRILPREELQLLDSEMVVTTDTSPKYDREIHDDYTMAICCNRQQALRALLIKDTDSDKIVINTTAPPRAISTNWPFYSDNTVFGENYAKMTEIPGEVSWRSEHAGDEEDPDIPSGGWLVIACFHTLWSTGSLKLMPQMNDIVPLYQDVASFLSVRADARELSHISASLKVDCFPTVIIFRGGKELDRVEGHERGIEKVIRIINQHATPGDKMSHMKRRHRIRLEKQLASGGTGVEDVDEPGEQGQIDWTWDPEYCSKTMSVQAEGMNVVMKEEVSFADRVTWEYARFNSRDRFRPLKQKHQDELEKYYKKGKLYSQEFFEFGDSEDYVEVADVTISSYLVSGFIGYYRDMYVSYRRDGERLSVPNEEKYLTQEQKEKDKRAAEWREKWEAQKKKIKEEKIGRDVESIRGTTGFVKNSGVHYWELKWGHVPGREGVSDSFGICSDLFESFGPDVSPLLGSSTDEGTSLALHSDGAIYYQGRVLHSVKRPLPSSDKEQNESTEKDFSVNNDESKDFQGGRPSEEFNAGVNNNQTTSPLSSMGNPLLFGKDSVVKCELDSDNEGGILRFYIDGVKLNEEIAGVYEMLGGTEIFPIISMCPLDPNTPSGSTTSDKKEEKKGQSEKKQNSEEEEQEDDDNKSEKSDEDDEIYPTVILLPYEEELTQKASTAKTQGEEKDTEVNDNGKGDNSGDDNSEENSKENETIEVNTSDQNVRWMYEDDSGWNVYSEKLSCEIEEACREGKTRYLVNVGTSSHQLFFDSKKIEISDDPNSRGKSKRIRRHVLSKDIDSLWELLSFKYQKPFGLYGAGSIQIMEKIRASNESMSGKEAGLGFLFLYSLLTGDTKVKVLGGGGYSSKGFGSYGPMSIFSSTGMTDTGSSRDDSHRFALLLAQFYVDRHTKSLPGSVVNVLCRNRHVSLRMPKFKDTRKNTSSHQFNGWIDESDPRSPVAELFSKLMHTMSNLKRKGAFRFPPPPPHDELPALDSSVKFTFPTEENKMKRFPHIFFDRPELSDFGCEQQELRKIDITSIQKLALHCGHRIGADELKPEPPKRIEDTDHFVDVMNKNIGRVVVLDFHASWCNPCHMLAPVYRMLSLSTPTALFLKVDVDECDDLAQLFDIKSMPTIKFIRGAVYNATSRASSYEKVIEKSLSRASSRSSVTVTELGTIIGADASFVEQFMKVLHDNLTPQEMKTLKEFHNNTPGANLDAALDNMSASEDLVVTLATKPLKNCSDYVASFTRIDLGMEEVNPVLAFDVSTHDAASTAPAVSVLQRFKDDVEAYASNANTQDVLRVAQLFDKDIQNYFRDAQGSEQKLRGGLEIVKLLSVNLHKIRDADAMMIQEAIPLLQKAVNWVDVSKNDSIEQKKAKIRFLLNRQAGQDVWVWMEFLFGTLISSQGDQDLLRLNPYLPSEIASSMTTLVTISMLRANRLGLVNKCIGAIISLETLLLNALAMSKDNLAFAGDALIPQIVQSSEDLSKIVSSARHYMTPIEGGANKFHYDPRYLIFEFVWNIQLRKKQVEIVNDFRRCLSTDKSKVKQMIMGAGKTSVVAPLLALIAADGSHLVLSVVPKALVEMSRTTMRETFSTIMTKRIYTLDFDRSTMIRPSMRRSLENAMLNRGIVVATPTTLKSIMLSYIETEQQLKLTELTAVQREKLRVQSIELHKILKLFKEGIMLLDEVDLILHPLKSELNFPIGEKFDLDGSEEGERWSLPIHIMDAIFYTHTGNYSALENTFAIDVLNRLSVVVQKGIELRSLQRLPHMILLNVEYYRSHMMPLMAEWCYLWLQKQHLHGIDQSEVVRYLIEGAASRSDASIKQKLIELAIKKVEVDLGQSPSCKLTPGYQRSMSDEEREEQLFAISELQRQTSETVKEDTTNYELLLKQQMYLQRVHASTEEQCKLMNEIHDLNARIEDERATESKKIAEVQSNILMLNKKIQDLECPRDKSLDNSVVVWCSEAFTHIGEVVSDANMANTGESNSNSEGSVYNICSVLEDMGITIRRCSDVDEAISRSRDLQKENQLRCLIIGGNERKPGCGPSCTKSHNTLCLLCGNPWSHHNGHTCRNSGRRGSFPIDGKKISESKIDGLGAIGTLVDATSSYARANSHALPANRACIYCAHMNFKEDKRMGLWRLGSLAFDESKGLIEWVKTMPKWDGHQDEGETDESDSDDSANDNASANDVAAAADLSTLRAEVESLENQKAQLDAQDESDRKILQNLATEKHFLLEKSVNDQIEELDDLLKKLSDVNSHIAHSDVVEDDLLHTQCNPSNGRDVAYAFAWYECNKKWLSDPSCQTSEKNAVVVARHMKNVKSEMKFLQQVMLATKVTTHITSPQHKKLLNLCHHWLITYLPHCLAKINRVSFGLLSADDCAAALAADPHVPRSRLKLAVPFIGKDVPSKSSEFAHPDVIIGLTILAYRYSGLRKDDYIDIIDSITSQFVREIGPSKERPSNLRHEQWVYAAGGSIRGLKTTQDGKIWKTSEQFSEGDDKEVVQLKFLQKSNVEQMDKLYNLLKLEPCVIHDYLERNIFPVHMRSQRKKISASGQAIGGDMLVGKRVGFSGTPSDLLPEELGRCDYEKGDDGMMISTVLDRRVASHLFVKDGWTVEFLLQNIANAEPRFHALIDTGALITGYSNLEVAKYLLKHGLTWCEGVVFLDEEDKKQVLVRATMRVVSADQCGVSLEKRFAFYDQIHTTGMDIKHVVNATAAITLGKDMVFRDYVQGAYRMRGIGQGQKVCVFIIPEVKELMNRELKSCAIKKSRNLGDHVLEDVVAWLIINSLRSEQTQWTMLCLQNVSNLYRKNAFECLQENMRQLVSNSDGSCSLEFDDAITCTERMKFIRNLSKDAALQLFDEEIDFSLEANTPNPQSFEDKLKDMLEDHDVFIRPEQHVIGNDIMNMVGQFSMIEGSANRLEQEQEREQEQEQEKEIEAKKDQQIEVEKFVDREYSRQEEVQKPWPFSILSKPLQTSSDDDDSPFYPLNKFKLRHQESLQFFDKLYLSNNYFNPNWSGLRRIKNVIMVMEYRPSTTIDSIRLETEEKLHASLTESQEEALHKAHLLLGFHASSTGFKDVLLKEDLRLAVQNIINKPPTDDLIDHLIETYSSTGESTISLQDFRRMLTDGELFPRSSNRYYVGLSLAEAETIRKILHVRSSHKKNNQLKHTDLALRYSPVASSGSSSAGDGGIIFDVSTGWKSGTGSTSYEASVAHSSFRFFDGDMHYSMTAVNILIGSLRSSTMEREKFFQITSGARRRLERRWQDTPLAKVFQVADQWAALKQRAQATYFSEALKARGIDSWSAFAAIDYDNNGVLSPAEFYGALRWLGFPNLTIEDVADFIEAVDSNCDGMVEYKDYIEMLNPQLDYIIKDEDDANSNDFGDDHDYDPATPANILDKVEPYGGEEIREEMIKRRQRQQQRVRDDRLRRQAHAEALDMKVFEEELETSKRRVGGANPHIFYHNDDTIVCTEFKFSNNGHPVRFVATGKNMFIAEDVDTAAERTRPVSPFCCPRGSSHKIIRGYNYYSRCSLCNGHNPEMTCGSCRWPNEFRVCNKCINDDKSKKEAERRDPSKHPTFLRCLSGCAFYLQIPFAGGANKNNGCFMISMELRLRKLPTTGSMQTLLRFSQQSLSNKTSGKGIVHVTSSGSLVIRPQKFNVEEEKVKKLVFNSSVDVEKRKGMLESEHLKQLIELQTRVSTELVQSFGCSGMNSQKLGKKIVEMFTEYPDILKICSESTIALKIHTREALKTLSKGGIKFHKQLRNAQKKLNEDRDGILSCQKEISNNEKCKIEKNEIAVVSNRYINSNKGILSDLGDQESPSKALLTILDAYSILFTLENKDEATERKISDNTREGGEDSDGIGTEKKTESEKGEDDDEEEDSGDDEDEESENSSNFSWDELKLLIKDAEGFVSKMKLGKDLLEKLSIDDLNDLVEATTSPECFKESKYSKFYNEKEVSQRCKSSEAMEINLRDWIQSVVSYRSLVLSTESNRSCIESLKKSCDEAIVATEVMKAELALCAEATKLIKPSIRPNVWCIIHVNVNPKVGKISVFLNDVLLDEEIDVNPSELKLQHTLTVLGGGKQAFNKGGDVRRILVYGAEFSERQTKEEHYRIAANSSLISKQALKIQTLVRGHIERKKFVKRKEEESAETGHIFFD